MILRSLRCVFRCNTATNGEGGGFNDGGPDSNVTVTECTIDGNTAGGNGGGFAAEGVTLIMKKSTVSNNRSGSDGGGMYVITSGFNQTLSFIENCTISGNGAADSGGGVDFEGEGQLAFAFNTIAFNASFNGGGIAQTDGGGQVQLVDNIVAKNIATNGPDIYDTQDPFNDAGHNLFFSLLGQGTAGIDDPVNPGPVVNADNDLIRFDPKLGPLANNGGLTKTHALLKGSPAINAADDFYAPPTDQRGVKRPQGLHSDIGAYEKK